jgi:hypothetical protein
MEKKEFEVLRKASKTMFNVNMTLMIMGWLILALGVLITIVGVLNGAVNETIFGCSCLYLAFTCLIYGYLFLGIHSIVKASELFNAINENEYNIKDIFAEDDDE